MLSEDSIKLICTTVMVVAFIVMITFIAIFAH